MKFVFALITAALVGCTWAEECASTDNCSNHTHCDAGYHISCTNLFCTCTVNNSVQCASQADCSTGHGDCGRIWHCIDSKCRCGGNFGGRK